MSEQPKKVLYIEDDPEARYLMADIIRYKGYVYLEASRGLEGIKIAREHNPDLILIDLRLPDMQGYEVTTHLKSLPGLGETPIIALTGETQKDVKNVVLAAGCDGYITKPINVTEFLFRIEEFFAGKKESVQPEEEKFYLQQYNIQLVARLKKKIDELEDVNKNLSVVNDELLRSREELAQYNDRLFYLNNLANFLRTLDDPGQLIELLPKKVMSGFQIDRCIIFELDVTANLMYPVAASGIAYSTLKEIKIHYSSAFVEQIRNEGGFIWIKDPSEIIDDALREFARSMEAQAFIAGHLSHLGAATETNILIDRYSGDDLSQKQAAHSRFYLIYMDRAKSGKEFATYEVRILKSFTQTVGIIHENMTLYNRLLESYKKKSQEAIRDGLTRIYNYRYFIQELERECNRTKRFNTPFSLLMIDIDHFKEYNDRHGHLEGDKVLKTIARLLDENTRSTDTVARYGGEEFTIIMPSLRKKEAVNIARKLNKLVSGYHFPNARKKQSESLTISIGLSSCPEDSEDPTTLLDLADQALYQAKESGRNKVCIS